jgi:ser/thr/tyr protein kinase RAD53
MPQEEQDSFIIDNDSDYPLIATQQLTQSQHVTYDPNIDQHLVGCLIPATAKCPLFELCKSKENRQWTIGRYGTNDIILSGLRLSEHLAPFRLAVNVSLILFSPGNYHCKLIWNGKQGKLSEVRLEDHSSNGTWVNNAYVTKGQQTILRSGASISLGAAPDMANNDYSKRQSSSNHSESHALCA